MLLSALCRESDMLAAGPSLKLDIQRPSHDDLMDRVELINWTFSLQMHWKWCRL